MKSRWAAAAERQGLQSGYAFLVATLHHIQARVPCTEIGTQPTRAWHLEGCLFQTFQGCASSPDPACLLYDVFRHTETRQASIAPL